MKTDSFRSVYRMNYLLSTAANGHKRAGYLLIELMIALTAIAIFSLLVAQLQAHMVHRYYEAEQYFLAVNYASRAFEERVVGTREMDGYTIEVMFHGVQGGLPYKHAVVTVSWKTGNGAVKQIVIQGGMLDEQTST